MNNFIYLKRVKTHDSNITEKPVALIYNIYKVINSTLKRLKATYSKYIKDLRIINLYIQIICNLLITIIIQSDRCPYKILRSSF